MVQDSRPRVVFDCMIFLQAVTSEFGPASALLRLVDNDLIRLFVTPAILEEIRDVLSRPRIVQKNPQLTEEYIDAMIARLLYKATLRDKVSKHFKFERDPKDEIYLNAAITAKANYLVSRDKDLLDLMHIESVESRSFRERFPEIMILDPVAFLRLHEASMVDDRRRLRSKE